MVMGVGVKFSNCYLSFYSEQENITSLCPVLLSLYRSGGYVGKTWSASLNSASSFCHRTLSDAFTYLDFVFVPFIKI